MFGSRRAMTLMTIIALSLAAPSLAEEAKQSDECARTLEELEERVDVLEADKGLPSTYQELVLLPLDVRKEVFRRMPAELQVGIWKAHLSSFRDGDLTSDQRIALLNFKEILSVDGLIALRESDIKQGSPLETSLLALGAVFSNEQLADLTARLSSPSSPEVWVGEEDRGLCDCARSWYNECLTWSYCGPKDCETSPRGCGALWQQECNGVCCLLFRPCPPGS